MNHARHKTHKYPAAKRASSGGPLRGKLIACDSPEGWRLGEVVAVHDGMIEAKLVAGLWANASAAA
jgi:hypothetical protein